MKRAFVQLFALICLSLLSLGGCREVCDDKDVIISEDSSNGRLSESSDVLDAVVRIDVWDKNFDSGAEHTQRGQGSGTILTQQGHILTNAHVASPYAKDITVTLANSEVVRAKFIGWDHWTDLAVIQLDMDEAHERGLDFKIGAFADSNPKLVERVYAVGTPFGLERTITSGIISNKSRFFQGSQSLRGRETGYFNTWLQTDAAINPGNSGGPLVNEQGLLVGVNTRGIIASVGESLNFAIPLETAMPVMEELIKNGKVTRSYVGIELGEMRDFESHYSLDTNKGVLVNKVDAGSPASRVNLNPGDIILEINGKSVDGRFPEQLPGILNQVARLPVGSKVTLEVLSSNGKRSSLEMTTELLESRVGEELALEEWGVTVEKLTRIIAREKSLKSDLGVIVKGVQPGFPAAYAEVQRGDIIQKIEGKDITSIQILEQIYTAYEEDPKDTLLDIWRNYGTVKVLMKP